MLNAGGARMLAIIGVILIVLWLIGLAFKVTVWAIHLALIVGLVLIVLNFLVGRRPTAVP
jgi:membrane-bound ClpP family serine protease